MGGQGAGEAQQPAEVEGLARRAKATGMGKAPVEVARRQPRRQGASGEGFGTPRRGTVEREREGAVAVRGIVQRVAAGATRLGRGHQRGAVPGLGGAHQLGEVLGKVGQPRRRGLARAPLRHRRHEPVRAGPRVWEMRHAEVARQGDVRPVAGALAAAQLQAHAVEHRQKREDMDVADGRIVVPPSLPRHRRAGQAEGVPQHPERPAPAGPVQAAPPRQRQGHRQDLGLPLGGVA